MQADWNKYGAANFSFRVLEKCPVEKLNEREIYWIKEFNCTDHSIGYNIQVGGAHKSKDEGIPISRPKYKNRTKYKRK